jgi:hypothetical protein
MKKIKAKLNRTHTYNDLVSLLCTYYTVLRVKKEYIEETKEILDNLHLRCQKKHPEGIRILQWNLLARLLSDDGFLMNWVIDTTGRESPAESPSELYDIMRDAIKNKRIDEIAKKYREDEYMIKNDAIMFDHTRRLILIKIYVLIYQPDFIVFEECDFVKDIEYILHNNYTCGIGIENLDTFKFARDMGIIDNTDESKIYSYLTETNALIAPKIDSTGVKIGIRNKLPEDILLDDNVVVFYNKDKFIKHSINYKIIPSSITFCAKFLSRESRQEFNIFPVHLPSGDAVKDVIKRKKACDALMHFVSTNSECPSIIVGDFNSRPNESFDGNPELISAWNILTNEKFISCWTDYYNADGSFSTKYEPNTYEPNTTVKCRGPLTTQPKKMGEFMKGPIDYVWLRGGRDLRLISDPRIIEHEKYNSDKGYQKHIQDTLVIPSKTEPSDHYALVVDLYL